MLDAVIISPLRFSWAFPVVITTYKDAEQRFCVDHRKLKKVMVADRWPMPRVDEILEDLDGSEYFSSINLFAGYWQIRMEETSKGKTTFRCRLRNIQI